MPTTGPLVTGDELARALGMAATNSDTDDCAAGASDWLLHYLTEEPDHAEHKWCRQAGLEVAVNMWQSARSAGGQPVSIDFTPAPYAMGPSLLRRVSGIIGPCRDLGGVIG